MADRVKVRRAGKLRGKVSLPRPTGAQHGVLAEGGCVYARERATYPGGDRLSPLGR